MKKHKKTARYRLRNRARVRFAPHDATAVGGRVAIVDDFCEIISWR
ncbi:MAG: hypothetical protein ACOVNQ_00075 [Pirellula sp.]